LHHNLELLQIAYGCSTDGPECESSREYEGQDAELGKAARLHQLGSSIFLRVSDSAAPANRTKSDIGLLLRTGCVKTDSGFYEVRGMGPGYNIDFKYY
jgi:hypothetical protein